jgi:tRNA-guanine family transglycosylase
LLVSEPTAARLLTLHNVHWCLDLLRRARAAIREGRMAALVAEVAAVWP